MQLGYSAYLVYGIFLIGIIFLYFSPYWTFLLSVILFNSLNVYDAVYTRTEVLGPYFNLYDALFVLGLTALLFDKKSRPFVLPKPVIWILGVLIIGILQTSIYFEINYLVLRAIRWALTLPLAFLIAANLVVDSSRARLFLFAVILGSVIGSVMGFFEYRSVSLLQAGMEAAPRLPTAGSPLGGSLLVAATQQAFFPYAPWLLKLTWGGCLVLFGMCILFGQWRAVYLGVLLTVITMPLFFRRWHTLWRSVLMASLGLAVILVALFVAFPWVRPASTFDRMVMMRRYEEPGAAFQDQGRIDAIAREVEEWSKGNWLLGRGLSFTAFLVDGSDRRVAWGHIGYASYLSHLGLLGLVVFGIYLPLVVFNAGKGLYFSRDGPVALIGLVTMVTVVMEAIMSGMSTSYFSPTKHATGFLYGAAWALAYGKASRANFAFIWSTSKPKGNLPPRPTG